MAATGVIFKWLCGLSLPLLAILLFKRHRKRLRTNPDNKHVVVTGASAGLGRNIAKFLDGEGFHVFASARREDALQELKAECSERMKVIPLDVTDPRQVQQALEYVTRELPSDTGLWGLVNNAGVFIPGPVEWMTVEEYKQIAEVNLWGTVRMTKAFLPLLKREKGRVVNISSVAGMVPLQRSSAYCISKFGVSVFSDALRREMSPWGVGVVLVEPGAFKTQATDPKATKENIKGLWDRLDPTTREEYGQDHFLSVCTMLDYHLSKSSTSLESVSHVVHDALTSRDPKTRYQVGVDACLFRLVAALPTVISDFVLSKLIERVEIPPQGC